MPATGCVENETRGWGPGYILFRSLANSSSSLLTKDAPNWPEFAESTSFMLSFCTKLEREADIGAVKWPMGHYGIFKTWSNCSPGSYFSCTVLRMIKLKKCSVPVQFRCGFGTLKLCRYFTIRRLTKIKNMCNVLKYRKLF